MIDKYVHITLDRYAGDGPPVLLLHGIPGTRRTWGQVADRICPTHAVIVPDLLGFGGSSEPPGDRHAPGQAVAMLELLSRLGIADTHLVGFDFGGPVALTMYQAGRVGEELGPALRQQLRATVRHDAIRLHNTSSGARGPGDLAGAGHSRLRAAPRPEPGAVRH